MKEQIIALRKEGVGTREIARRLAVSPGSVAGHLHRAGMTNLTAGAGGRGNGIDPETKRTAVELYWKSGGRAAAAFAGVTVSAAHLWASKS